MQIPTTAKLGEISAITMATPDLQASLAFYQQLGFTETMRMDIPFPWIQVTDGALLILLRKGTDHYIALTYYVNDIDAKIAELENDGIVFAMKPGANDMVKRALIKSPDGTNIGLVGFVEGFAKPPGKNLLTMEPEDFFNPAKYTNQVCGVFGEFALAVADLEKSLVFWKLLGFNELSKRDAPYPWAILSDGVSIVGLHQTNNFTEPTITFFAADIKEKVAALKAAGIMGFIDKVQNNVTLTTPENQHINLFNLGM